MTEQPTTYETEETSTIIIEPEWKKTNCTAKRCNDMTEVTAWQIVS